MISNCIIFALQLWLRNMRRARRRRQENKPSADCYLCWRASRVPWGIFHVLHGRWDKTTGQIKVVSFKPDVPDKVRIEPLFKGRVERGD